MNLERLADHEIAHSAEDDGDGDYVKQTKPKLGTHWYRLGPSSAGILAEAKTGRLFVLANSCARGRPDSSLDRPSSQPVCQSFTFVLMV